MVQDRTGTVVEEEKAPKPQLDGCWQHPSGF